MHDPNTDPFWDFPPKSIGADENPFDPNEKVDDRTRGDDGMDVGTVESDTTGPNENRDWECNFSNGGADDEACGVFVDDESIKKLASFDVGTE